MTEIVIRKSKAKGDFTAEEDSQLISDNVI